MKRQNSILSSSSCRREISSNNLRHYKTFGCLSGIFHFLSKNQRSSKKRIAFVKNDVIVTPSETESSETATVSEDLQNSSMNVPIEKFREAPGAVARLMGVESSTDAAEMEKKMKVMFDLQKCEEDLKAIKKLIEGIESSMESVEVVSGDRELIRFWEEQPSPVSVLDRPRHFPHTSFHNCMFFEWPSATSGRIEPQKIERKKAEEKKMLNLSEFESIGVYRREKAAKFELQGSKERSKEMRESVEGVCRDINWGQRREATRIGVALQHQIFLELIEEFLMDFKFICASSFCSLPFEACKRRLCF